MHSSINKIINAQLANLYNINILKASPTGWDVLRQFLTAIELEIDKTKAPNVVAADRKK